MRGSGTKSKTSSAAVNRLHCCSKTSSRAVAALNGECEGCHPWTGVGGQMLGTGAPMCAMMLVCVSVCVCVCERVCLLSLSLSLSLSLARSLARSSFPPPSFPRSLALFPTHCRSHTRADMTHSAPSPAGAASCERCARPSSRGPCRLIGCPGCSAACCAQVGQVGLPKEPCKRALWYSKETC